MTNEPISVLHFSNEFVRGGAEEHMLMLLRQLDRKQFRPFLVCPPECLEKLRPDLPADVAATPLTFQSPTQVGAALSFARILRRNKIGIVHSHMFHASLVASPVAQLCRVPVVVETPHIREAWRHGWLKGSYFIDRIAGRFVDRYIAVSHANARYLGEEKRLPARKVQVIHNGCDLRRFSPNRTPPPGRKRSLGFAESDPVVLMVGRLEEQKGHRVLLDAFSDVVREIPTVRLVCAGEGSLRAQLERQTEMLGLTSNVRFVGFQSNTPEWLALANLVVLPSFFEGLPLVAIESLAAARPMVATAVDGTAEVIVNEKTGLTVPPGDTKALANAIVRLLTNPAFAAQMASAGRKWVLEEFSTDKQVQETQGLYLNAWRAAGNEQDSSCSEGLPEMRTVEQRVSPYGKQAGVRE